MADQILEVTTDLADALTRVLGPPPPQPRLVDVLAAYLDSLSREYGLTTSAPDVGRAERPHAPSRALGLIGEFFADAELLEDEVRLGDTLYDLMSDLCEDLRSRKLLNERKPLTPIELMQLGQIYWNLDGTDSRPGLPIRPSEEFAIKVPRANADFASMVWSSRLKNGPAGLREHSFRVKGARLAVLMAERLVDLNPATANAPTGARFVFTSGVSTRRLSSVAWKEHRQPSATRMFTSRARAYFAIDSFEQDIRYLASQVQPEFGTAPKITDAPADELPASQLGGDAESASDSSIDPTEAWDQLLACAHMLPADFADLLGATSDWQDQFVPIRNRIMRGRPLRAEDLATAELYIQQLDSPRFSRTRSALERLRANRELQPRARPGSAVPERVLHNLPFADFDATGLLGREVQVDKVVSMLRQRRFPVVTLTGEGGIGKTALALEICYRLVDDPEPPFDMVLWTSLKSERLTTSGIREVSNAVRGVEGAAGVLGRAIDQTFQGRVRELAAMLEGSSTLVVIDNLETAQGKEVLQLVEALPASVEFLFTSRVGVGDLERREPVGPLPEASAATLFTEFSLNRGLTELAAWPAERVAGVVHQLRCSPLAIRWYVLSIEAGRTPSDVIRDQGELLRFCVQNVIDALSDDERLLVAVLRALGRPVSFDELAVISEIEIDTLRSGAQRLTQGSLLVHSQAADPDETDTLALSSTARAYLPATPSLDVTEAILQREVAYNQERERSRLGARGRYLDVNVIFERPAGDAPTAHLLRRALREDKSGRSREATSTIARAREINPGYFEVDRVDAVLASRRGDAARATTLYRSALDSCETDEERAWVGFFYAGHLARRAFDLPTAIAWAERSHATFGSFDSALQLGNLYVWDRRFAEGKEHVEAALKMVPGPRFERIATTSLVECFKRWSEADLATGLATAAVGRALSGAQLGLKLHGTDSTDEPLMRSILEAATAALNAANDAPNLAPSAAEHLTTVLSIVGADRRFRVLGPWNHLERATRSIATDRHPTLGPALMAAIAEPMEASTTSESDPSSHGVQLHGSIARIGPKYGFIAHADFPDKVFIHAGSLRWPTKLSDLSVGTLVEFTPYLNAAGEQQARDVSPV